MNAQQRQVIDQYLDAIKGDFKTQTLAKKIVKENPGLFDYKDWENVRGVLRYTRGASGTSKRKSAERSGTLRFVREEMKPSEYIAKYLEAGKKTSKETWHLPEEYKSVLVMSDLHIPYHHLPSIEVALDYGFKKGVDCIYINGDLIDFAKISRWKKDPSMASTAVEIDMVRTFLEGLTSLGLPVFFKLGNHEDRWERYLLDNAPELYNIADFQMSQILRLDELEIELIDSKQRSKFGKLNVVHGHEFGESIFSPVNPARGLFLRAKTSVIAGHNHQTSSHHENNLNGKPTACWSTGCLCDLEPEYRPFAYTKWNHGASIIEMDGEEFHVDNFRILNGKIA